jgi:hypothetical protein
MKRFGWIALVVLTAATVGGCRTRASYFADTYEECSRDRDCFYFPDDLCYTVFGDRVAAGMCTHECEVDAHCAFGGLCEFIDGPWLCYLPCFIDADCPWGFGCFEVDQWDYLVDVCLPI